MNAGVLVSLVYNVVGIMIVSEVVNIFIDIFIVVVLQIIKLFNNLIIYFLYVYNLYTIYTFTI